MGQLNQRLTADFFGNHDMRWTQRKPLTDTMMTRNFAKSKAHTIAQLGPAMALVLSLALSSPQVLASGQNAVALSITAAPAVAQDDQPSQDQTIVEGLRLAPAALRSFDTEGRVPMHHAATHNQASVSILFHLLRKF